MITKRKKELKAEATIGEGIYSVKDVSQILFLPYHKVNYWLNVFWDNKFINNNFKSYSFGSKQNRAVNFYTLIEFYTFYKLRQAGLSARKIQDAHEVISKELKTPYPFATQIRTDGRCVWYEHPIFQDIIKADGKSQITIKDILLPYLKKIDFGDDGIAKQFFPIGKNHDIVVNPKNQFGQPIIKGTNIKTHIINGFLESGDSIESISELYNISTSQIKDVREFYKVKKAA